MSYTLALLATHRTAYEPLSSAPLDGTPVILVLASGVGEAVYVDGAWYWREGDPAQTSTRQVRGAILGWRKT